MKITLLIEVDENTAKDCRKLVAEGVASDAEYAIAKGYEALSEAMKKKAFSNDIKSENNIIKNTVDCKFYLPCGRCDRTGEFCSQLGANGFYIPVDNGSVTPV